MNLKQFERRMKALSNSTRLKIVNMLSHRKNMCVCELQSVLGMTQPSVSQHLKVLEQAGIIEQCRNGMWVEYSLVDLEDEDCLKKLLEIVCNCMEQDEEIAKIVAVLASIDRSNIVN